MPLSGGLGAVILAGGRGTRLRSVVSDRPKVLAPVLGRPFLAYLIWRLSGLGLKEIVISTGYLAEMVAEVLGQELFGVRLVYSRELTPLGTAGGLRLALDKVREDNILVLNGDSFVDTDLDGFLAWFEQGGYKAGMLLAEVADSARFGRVSLAESGRVSGFSEKGQAGPGLINAGIYVLTREVVEMIPEAENYSLETGLFPRLLPDTLHGYPAKAAFIDIGTPESYAKAEQFFAHLVL